MFCDCPSTVNRDHSIAVKGKVMLTTCELLYAMILLQHSPTSGGQRDSISHTVPTREAGILRQHPQCIQESTQLTDPHGIARGRMALLLEKESRGGNQKGVVHCRTQHLNDRGL